MSVWVSNHLLHLPAIMGLEWETRSHFNINTIFPDMRIPTIVKIKWLWDCYFYNVIPTLGIPILVRQHLYTKTALCWLLYTNNTNPHGKNQLALSIRNTADSEHHCATKTLFNKCFYPSNQNLLRNCQCCNPKSLETDKCNAANMCNFLHGHGFCIWNFTRY